MSFGFEVSIVALIFAVVLFSGVLNKIFLNVLLTAVTVTLTTWILLLIAGIGLFVVLPIYCGFTNQDTETVIRHMFFEAGLYQSLFSSRP